MEPPNTWKSEYLFLGRYTVVLFTHFKARPISQTSRFDIPIDPELTTMTSVSVRFEEVTGLNYKVKQRRSLPIKEIGEMSLS